MQHRGENVDRHLELTKQKTILEILQTTLLSEKDIRWFQRVRQRADTERTYGLRGRVGAVRCAQPRCRCGQTDRPAGGQTGRRAPQRQTTDEK